MAAHRSDVVTDVARALEWAGRSPAFYFWSAVAFVVVVTVARQWRAAWPIAVAVVLADLSVGVLKPVIERPRPPSDLMLTVISGYAMPSTHAAVTASLAVALVLAPWWSSRRARTVVAVVGGLGCLLAGAAMVYLGGHWVTDVLAGWALGAAIAVVVRTVAERPASLVL